MDLLPGTWLDGHLRLDAPIGTGGHGEVWAAWSERLGREVAVKILLDQHGASRQQIARFEREARLLADLDDPHVVALFESGHTATGTPYWVMERLRGEDLGARLKRAPLPLPEAQTLAVIAQTCSALSRAHEVGIVHRDVKPANVFLVAEPSAAIHVKLLDFGVAKREGVEPLELTHTGVFIGTPFYMSPEQLVDPRTVDHRTDLWAVGVVAYVCLTGQLPFQANNLAALSVAIHAGEVTAPTRIRSELPGAVDAWMRRALAREREDRFASATELAEAFEHAIFQPRPDSERAPPTTRFVPRPSWSGERRMECLLVLPSVALASTVTGDLGDALGRVERIVRAADARLEILPTGERIVTVPNAVTADEAAARVVRCGLALVRAAGVGGVVLSARAAADRDRRALLDRAGPLLAGGDALRLDDTAAALVRDRFDVAREGEGWVVRRARPATSEQAVLLGGPTPFLGRERELSQIESAYAASVDEPAAHVVVVSGAPGVGKSRLTREVVRRLQVGRAWSGRADAGDADAAFSLLRALLRDAAGLGDGAASAEDEERFAHFVSTRTTRAGVVEGLAAVAFGRAFETGRGATPTRDQIIAAWLELVGAECAREPVFLVLDDVHWADRVSLDLVDLALQRHREQALFVLASARPEIHERFPDLFRRRARSELALGGISKKSASRLVQAVLGKMVPADVATRIAERADGNPFMLEELIRASVGLVEGDTPASVLATVEARITRQPPEQRRALRAAAVLGPLFTVEGVGALLGDVPAVVHAALRDLDLAELVAREEGSAAVFRFRHALVRDAAYAMVPEAERREAHRRAALWLEGRDADPSELAEHFFLAGDAEAAAREHARAAKRLVRVGDFENADRQASRALALGTITGEARAEVLVVRAECESAKGRFAQSDALAKEALADAPPGAAVRAQAQRVLAVLAWRQSRPEDLDRLVDEIVASPAPREPGDPLDAFVRACSTLGQLAGLRGDRARARDVLFHAIEHDVPGLEASPLTQAHRCEIFSHLARFDEKLESAADWKSKAAVWFRAAGELHRVAVVLESLGCAYWLMGLAVEAHDALSEAVEQALALGADTLEITARQNRAVALALLGRLEEAEAEQAWALERLVAVGDLRMASWSRCYLAGLRAARDPDGSLAEIERAIVEAAGHEPARAHHLAMAADLHLARGDVARADQASAAASEILERLGWVGEGEALVRVVRAETLERLGRAAEAKRAVVVAHGEIVRRAQLLARPAWRAAFLERVPEHARTIALAAKFGIASAI